MSDRYGLFKLANELKQRLEEAESEASFVVKQASDNSRLSEEISELRRAMTKTAQDVGGSKNDSVVESSNGGSLGELGKLAADQPRSVGCSEQEFEHYLATGSTGGI